MLKRILHELPIKNPLLLSGFCLISALFAIVLDLRFDTRFDAFFHDAAVVKTERTQWQHSALVALDPGVPGFVSRRQALPLFSLAAQRALDYGATAVFLDAVLYEYDRRTRYATCIETYQPTPVPNEFRWSEAEDIIPFSNLSPQQFEKFFIATPYFKDEDNFVTISLLQNYFGEELLPLDFFDDEKNANNVNRLFASPSVYQRTEGNFFGTFRWMNLSENSVVPKLTSLHRDALELSSHNHDTLEQCSGVNCQRVRFSLPKQAFDSNQSFPLIPVSQLAGCDSSSVPDSIKTQLKNKMVILQMTEPSEATDIKVTPMISAFGSSRKFLSGPQFLIDSIETEILGDMPRRPVVWQRALLLTLVCILAILAAAFLRTGYAFFIPFANGLLVWILCFVSAPAQLWPVVASIAASLLAISLVLATHISMGTAKGKLMAQYIPSQIRNLLLKYQGNKQFIHRRIDAVILMSDIVKYSNVTSELEDPAYVFRLLNEYFADTTLNTQEEFNGWLESYVGDMVCFYWPVVGETNLEQQETLALRAAVEMAHRQQKFFANLATNQALNIAPETLQKISKFIGAGIGLTSGEVMMGNLGPEHGVQKFGCLGDPLNLASRTESLTRYFNTEILITEELLESAKKCQLKTRKVTRVIVKGRLTPVTLYALGDDSDPRLEANKVKAWERWSEAVIHTPSTPYPDSLEEFEKDRDTILEWLSSDLLDQNTRSFVLKSK